MIARIATVAFQGIDVLPIEVQAQVASGLPAFTVVGLPDKAVGESRERVRAALNALGLALPPKPVVISSFVPAAPVVAQVRKLEKLDLDLSLLELSSEQMTAFAPGARGGILSVSASGQELVGKLVDLKNSSKGYVLASSRLQAEKAGEFSWKAADSSSLRVRIEPMSTNADGSTLLRIQPEASAPNEGATATRRIDSNITISSRHSALVSGLSLAGKGSHGGELLLVITPTSHK